MRKKQTFQQLEEAKNLLKNLYFQISNWYFNSINFDIK